jgi:hypothetical protein
MAEALKSHRRLRLNRRLISVHEIIEESVLMNFHLKLESFMERNFSGMVYDSTEIFYSDWMKMPAEGSSKSIEN